MKEALRNIFLYTAMTLAPLGTLGQADSRSLSELGPDEQAALAERYGPAAEPALDILRAIDKAKARRESSVDRATVDRAIARLASIDPEALGALDKEGLGRAWWKVAELTRRLDGPTSEMRQQLELAYSLAPAEKALAREVAYQRSRARLIDRRLAQAAEIRAARERGEDPYEDFEGKIARNR